MRPTLPFNRSTQARKTARRIKEHGSNGQAAGDRENVPGASQGHERYRAALLSSEASAILRDQLLAELEGLEPRTISTPGHSGHGQRQTP